MSPGTKFFDDWFAELDEEEAKEQATLNMTVENVREDDADKIVTTYKRNGADVRIVKNSDGTVNLSMKASGKSSIKDVVTGPNGLVRMTVDGVTHTTTGASAMEQLKQRGSYRRAPEVGVPLAHAAMRPSTWHRRWWHYLKRYVRQNRLSSISAVLTVPILNIVAKSAFDGAWLARWFLTCVVLVPVMMAVGAMELRQDMRKRTSRLVRNGWPRLEVKGHPGSVPVPFVVSPGEPISEKRGAHPIDPARPAIERLYDLLCAQDYDQGRLAIFENPHAVIDLTVAEAAYLLSAFDYDGGRTAALKMIRSKITDPTNGHLIVEPYDYDSSKREDVKLASDPWNGSPLS